MSAIELTPFVAKSLLATNGERRAVRGKTTSIITDGSPNTVNTHHADLLVRLGLAYDNLFNMVSATPEGVAWISAHEESLSTASTDMSAQNCLHRGQVVEYTDPNLTGMVIGRQVVVSDPDRFDHVYLRAPDASHPDYGTTTNDGGEWRPVPEPHQTVLERVAVAGVVCDPLPPGSTVETDESGQLDISDDEPPPWHFLFALLPPDVAEELTGPTGEWPDCWDLAVAVAKRIDAMESLLGRLEPHTDLDHDVSTPADVQEMVADKVAEQEQRRYQ